LPAIGRAAISPFASFEVSTPAAEVSSLDRAWPCDLDAFHRDWSYEVGPPIISFYAAFLDRFRSGLASTESSHAYLQITLSHARIQCLHMVVTAVRLVFTIGLLETGQSRLFGPPMRTVMRET
jgi:hypothetical protein